MTATIWSGFTPVAVALDLVLFLLGCGVFAWALLRAAGRSRERAISFGGLFFLAEGVAPRPVVIGLWGSVAVQVVVAVATAAVRPFSELAFGVLVPLFGFAMLALWSAVHGDFPPRDPAPVD
ncbi:MAG: hypothetical protein ACRD2C_19820 [Acidimicrobiales bacterium]